MTIGVINSLEATAAASEVDRGVHNGDSHHVARWPQSASQPGGFHVAA
jgi:hypothetical protein